MKHSNAFTAVTVFKLEQWLKQYNQERADNTKARARIQYVKRGKGK